MAMPAAGSVALTYASSSSALAAAARSRLASHAGSFPRLNERFAGAPTIRMRGNHLGLQLM
jgi:hypothetical protein